MDNRIEVSSSAVQDRITSWIHVVCGLLIVLIFLLDLALPLGVAMGVPYMAAVLISLWSPRRHFTIDVSAIASLLTVSVFFLKPQVAEMWKVVFNRALALFAVWVTAFLGLQRKATEAKRESALREREKAMEDIRILRGLMPICSSCKRIRDDRGYWTQLEGYIKAHSEAEFTHGICPECVEKLYPEVCGKLKCDSGTTK